MRGGAAGRLREASGRLREGRKDAVWEPGGPPAGPGPEPDPEPGLEPDPEPGLERRYLAMRDGS